jgi:hypothetical protein
VVRTTSLHNSKTNKNTCTPGSAITLIKQKNIHHQLVELSNKVQGLAQQLLEAVCADGTSGIGSTMGAQHGDGFDLQAYPKLQKVDEQACRIMQDCLQLVMQLTRDWISGLVPLLSQAMSLSARQHQHQQLEHSVSHCWTLWLGGLHACIREVVGCESRWFQTADRVGNLPVHFFNLNLRNLYAKSVHAKVADERKVTDQLRSMFLGRPVVSGIWDMGDSSQSKVTTTTTLVVGVAFLAAYRAATVAKHNVASQQLDDPFVSLTTARNDW